MSTLYTPSYGNTPAGVQLQNSDNIYSAIQGLSLPQATQVQSNATNAIANQYANPPDANALLRSNTNQLTNPLYAQQDKMAQLFHLYLADQGLAGKYQAITGGTGTQNQYADPNLLASAASGQNKLTSGNAADMASVAGMTTSEHPGAVYASPNTPGQISGEATASPVNPYLASSDAIIASAVNAPQAPSLTTAEIGQPIAGENQMLALINSLIGSEKTIAQGATQSQLDNYNAKLNALGNVLNLVNTVIGTKTTAGLSAGSTPGTKQNAGAIFQEIIDQLHQQKGNAVTEYDIWSYLNEHQGALEAQGVDMNELWRLHKDLATKVGTGGAISGGKATTTQQKLKDAQTTGLDALKGFGSLVNAYFKSSTDLGGVRVVNPLTGSYGSEKSVYKSKLVNALKAGRGKYILQDYENSLPGELTPSSKADSQLQGHAQQLLINNGLVLFRDKKTGNLGVVGENEFNPNTEDKIDATSIPVNTLAQVFSQL